MPPIQVTEKEYDRLVAHILQEKYRSDCINMKISPEKEQHIVNMVRENSSNYEIMRTLHTSNETITKVKKRRGLWGA